MATSRKQARELKQQGTPAMNIERASDRIQAALAYAWEMYYAGRHREFEDAAATLRKLSPYHSRELFNEISDMADAD